mmetsp:Transcript_3267/g.6271  ORF Transcript_3267/g.6271 Transcript_3267/m.6271 type:complete len:717 (-) Transcript_3267:712-2862(-)
MNANSSSIRSTPATVVFSSPSSDGATPLVCIPILICAPVALTHTAGPRLVCPRLYWVSLQSAFFQLFGLLNLIISHCLVVFAFAVRDKKHSHDFVLKLKIDNGGDVQVRRINVSEIWSKPNSQMSFAKMMSIASSYAFPENNVDDEAVRGAFIAKAKATYLDGDGDKITMTSNKELEDSFLQVLKRFPLHKPFRVTVTIPEDKSSKGCATATGGATGIPKRSQHRKIQARKNVFPVWIESSPKAMAGKSQTTLRVTPQKIEKDYFIHARHTCDGCSKSPIIGTRHHATKIPDFDLCSACFEKYEGEDLDFKPEIQGRDRRMQQKWARKWMTGSGKMSSDIHEHIVDTLNKAEGIFDLITVSRPCARNGPATERKKAEESPPAEKTSEDATASLKEVTEAHSGQVELQPKRLDREVEKLQESFTSESAGMDSLPTPKTETPSVEKSPGSPAASHDESFLSDADGNGSIAEAIGRTLDVCVHAMEEAMTAEMKEFEKVGATGHKESPQKTSDSKTTMDVDVAAVATVAADAFSVASSMVTSMSDILKKMEDTKKPDDGSGVAPLQANPWVNSGDDAAAFADVPSVVTGGTVLKSEDDAKKEKHVEIPKVEDVSDEEDEWSVISDDKVQAKHDEDFGTKANAKKDEQDTDRSVSSVEPISPFVLAKWDSELFQMHQLGFLDDRKNVDVLEHLEASHMGCDSVEKVTVQNAVEHLLGRRS